LGASLLADAVVVDVVQAPTIKAETSNKSTIDRVTPTTITTPSDHQLLDFLMDMATTTLVSTTEVVAVMAVALVLFAALHGIGPSNALMWVKKASMPSP